MRIIERILFFVFILVAFMATILNIALSESGKGEQFVVFDNIDRVYYNIDSIPDEVVRTELINLRDSGAVSTYSAMLKHSSSIIKLYGLMFALNSDKDTAFRFLPSLISSSVTVMIQDGNRSSEIVMAVAALELLTKTPQWIDLSLETQDIVKIKNDLNSAYNSNIARQNERYKIAVSKLITDYLPELARVLFPQDINNIDGKSVAEKIQISLMLASLENDKRQRLIGMLLKEEDQSILVNTMNAIGSTDGSDIASLLVPLMRNSNQNLSVLAIRKYSLLLKDRSLIEIEKFLDETNNIELIFVCLEQIEQYGDQRYYEMLKPYLTNHNQRINIKAIEAIEKTTYPYDPVSVMRTMSYLIGFTEVHTVEYAVRFYMRKNITHNHEQILNRLARLDDPKIKYLAIEYIDKFSLSGGYSIIERLTGDSDPEIQEKARQVLIKLGND